MTKNIARTFIARTLSDIARILIVLALAICAITAVSAKVAVQSEINCEEPYKIHRTDVHTISFETPVEYDQIKEVIEGPNTKDGPFLYHIKDYSEENGKLKWIQFYITDGTNFDYLIYGSKPLSRGWILQGQKIDWKDKSFFFLDTTDDEDEIGIDVLGQIEWIDVGSFVDAQGIILNVIKAKTGTFESDSDMAEIMMLNPFIDELGLKIGDLSNINHNVEEEDICLANEDIVIPENEYLKIKCEEEGSTKSDVYTLTFETPVEYEQIKNVIDGPIITYGLSNPEKNRTFSYYIQDYSEENGKLKWIKFHADSRIWLHKSFNKLLWKQKTVELIGEGYTVGSARISVNKAEAVSVQRGSFKNIDGIMISVLRTSDLHCQMPDCTTISHIVLLNPLIDELGLKLGKLSDISLNVEQQDLCSFYNYSKKEEPIVPKKPIIKPSTNPMIIKSIKSFITINPPGAYLSFRVIDRNYTNGLRALDHYSKFGKHESINNLSGPLLISSNRVVPEVDILLIDEQGNERKIFLPATKRKKTDISYENTYFWIADDGSSYYAYSGKHNSLPDLEYYEALDPKYLARAAKAKVYDPKEVVTVIIGENAPSGDVVSAVDISASIDFYTEGSKRLTRKPKVVDIGCNRGVKGIESKPSLLSSEVNNVRNLNAIIIGNPKTNPLVKEIYPDFYEKVKKDQAIIKFFKHGKKVQLVIGGYDEADTREAALILKNFKYTSIWDRTIILITDKLKIQINNSEEINESEIIIEDLNETEYNNSCYSGCLDEENCFPFGTIIIKENSTTHEYCDINKSLVEQKQENASCQNNYECLSNQCSNGKCVDLAKYIEQNEEMISEQTNIIEKIVIWIKKIFKNK
ncbi:hypothetical protein ACFL0W_03095 [Nanoarchaeota archaeon]